ncbi:sigma-70 family RNA polymerase sigma factor [Marinilactibacillus kalidii]|uniref:sigma-70 family RNA polymerase sigma factor n=1 Tax=Marinilactibacillus kalidii TaxID=2820274 RepID=UPI001ABEA7D5|nr:sigma-70 family RNA polymerase sigma factor [Marinilactibacillus kalidii]
MKQDDWIIKKLSQRKESGLTALIENYGGLLKSVIQKYLHALPDRQDECLNDVFLAVWNHIDQYDSTKSSFKNWICSVARYRAINYLKKYRSDSLLLDIDTQVTPKTTYEDTPFSKELWQIELHELLLPLKETDRKLFKDIFDSTYTTSEIAEKHGLSQGAFYSRVSRGKALIRHYFKTGGNGYD